MTREDIDRFNPNLAAMAAIFTRLAGTVFISVGILLMAVIYYGLRNAGRRAWWATVTVMGIVNAPIVAITRPVGGFPGCLSNSHAYSVSNRHCTCGQGSF